MTIEEIENKEQVKQFKCKIDFKQNTAGVYAFSGYIHFDDDSEEAIIEASVKLAKMVLINEERFKGMGRRVASDVKEKTKE